MSKRIRVKTLHLPIPLDDEERAIAEQIKREAERHGIAVVFGVKDLAIEELKILAFEHCQMPNTRHDALLFSASVNGEVFAYFNGSAPQSPLTEKMYKMLDGADHIAIGDTGFSNSESTIVPNLWKDCKTILIADERLLRFIPNHENMNNIVCISEPITFFAK
jgi:hypothetical protein